MRVHTEKQRLQRMFYSLHKNRPLVKTMMVIGTDGYITKQLDRIANIYIAYIINI